MDLQHLLPDGGALGHGCRQPPFLGPREPRVLRRGGEEVLHDLRHVRECGARGFWRRFYELQVRTCCSRTCEFF